MEKSWFPRPQFIKEAERKESGLRYSVNIVVYFVVFFLYLIGTSLLSSVFLYFGEGLSVGVEEVIANACNGIGILLALLFCQVFEKRGPRTLGYVKAGWGKEYLIGIAIGLGGFAICVLLGMTFGVVEITGFAPEIPWGVILLLFISYLIQGMNEEVLVRGYLMVSLDKKMPTWAGCLISGAFFSLLHILNGGAGVMSVLNVFVVGMFLGVLFLRRGSLWMAAGFHGAWNFTQGNLFGLSVSGNVTYTSVLSTKILPGNSLLTGGNFGLEASIFTTILAIVGIVAFMKLKPVDRSKE